MHFEIDTTNFHGIKYVNSGTVEATHQILEFGGETVLQLTSGTASKAGVIQLQVQNNVDGEIWNMIDNISTSTWDVRRSTGPLTQENLYQVDGVGSHQFNIWSSPSDGSFTVTSDVSANDLLSMTRAGQIQMHTQDQNWVMGNNVASNCFLIDGGTGVVSLSTEFRVGSTQETTDSGDFACGLVNSSRFVWDRSAEALRIYNSANTETHRIDTGNEQVVGPDGSNAAPAFSFLAETNSGFSRTAAGEIRMTTLGVGRQIITGSSITNGIRILNNDGVPNFSGCSFFLDVNTGMNRQTTDTIAFDTGGTEYVEMNTTDLRLLNSSATLVGHFNYADQCFHILERSGTPTMSGGSGEWGIFARSDGLYYAEDNGTVTGPLIDSSSAGMSDPMTTAGDLIYRNGSNTTTRLPRGTIDQYVTYDGSTLSWKDRFSLTEVEGSSYTATTSPGTFADWFDTTIVDLDSGGTAQIAYVDLLDVTADDIGKTLRIKVINNGTDDGGYVILRQANGTNWHVLYQDDILDLQAARTAAGNQYEVIGFKQAQVYSQIEAVNHQGTTAAPAYIAQMGETVHIDSDNAPSTSAVAGFVDLPNVLVNNQLGRHVKVVNINNGTLADQTVTIRHSGGGATVKTLSTANEWVTLVCIATSGTEWDVLDGGVIP